MSWLEVLISSGYSISKRVPNCRYSHLHALGIGDENLEELEKVSSGVLGF